MKLDRAEILRYMRMGRAEPDAALSARIDKIEREVIAVARPQEIHRLIPISELRYESADLRRVLGASERVFLFAATLGHEVDRLIRRYEVTSAADLLIVQATAATLIEAYIDACEVRLAAEAGGALTSRFSPGYGDLPLSVQGKFLADLDATRRLGITVNEVFMMTPSKSVTAIIGVKT